MTSRPPKGDEGKAVIRDAYLLDPALAYLNHGGFGAVPLPVLEERDRILRSVEANPTRHFMRELAGELDRALEPVAALVGCDAGDLAWTTNVTAGSNLVARSLMGGIRPGDEVLITDLEYGAQALLWAWVCETTGATLRVAPLCGLVSESMPSAVEACVSSATRIALVSHVTSATALLLPLGEIAGLLSERGVTVVVDGAHAPGHVPLELSSLACDFYLGNLHKWCAAARSSAFVYAKPEAQARLDPLVISWGGADRSHSLASRVNLPGTNDASAWLSVPRALSFHEEVLRPARAFARKRLEAAAGELAGTGFTRIGRTADDIMMSSFWLPAGLAPERLAGALQERRIEAVVTEQSTRPLLRVSVAWYTEDEELDRLLSCCRDLL